MGEIFSDSYSDCRNESKNTLRSFSHDVLAWPKFWARKPQTIVMENQV